MYIITAFRTKKSFFNMFAWHKIRGQCEISCVDVEIKAVFVIFHTWPDERSTSIIDLC